MTWPTLGEVEFSARLVLTLGHFLWQGVALAAAALLAAARAGRSAGARYLIYLSALVLMALAPVATFLILGGRSAIHSAAAAAPQAPAAVTSTIVPAPSGAARVKEVTTTALPPPRGDELAARAHQAGASNAARMPAHGPPVLRVGRAGPVPGNTAGISAGARDGGSSPVGSHIRWRRYAPQMAAAYFAGVALMLARLLLALSGTQRLRNIAAPVNDRDLLNTLEAVCRHLGVRRTPVLATCAKGTVPVVVGLLRPMILLPACLLTGLAPDQLRAILAHEVAHLRRLDPWANLFQRVVEAVLFFHPAVWLISRRLRAEREHCCDDLAASAAGESRRYAHALVLTAELCRIDCREQFALAAIDRPSGLRRRILRLLRGEEQPRPAAAAWPVVLLVAAAVLAAITLRHQPAVAGPAERPNATTAQPQNAVATDRTDEDRRIAEAIRVFSGQSVFDDPKYAWVASVRDLELIGRDAVPALCRELRTSDHGFYQCAAPLTLRAIGDRRAVPALIEALERSKVRASDCAFAIPSPELTAYYSDRQIERRVNGLQGTVGLGRPVREITAALERLTGHSEGDSHLGMYQDNGQFPTDFGPDQDERERMLNRAVAARWRAWWEANRAALLTRDELAWVVDFERAAAAASTGPATRPARTMALHATRDAGQPADGARIEVWADRAHWFTQADADGRAVLAIPPAKSASIVVRRPGSVPTRIWFGAADALPERYDLTLQSGVTIGGTVLGAGDKPAAGVRVFTVTAPKLGGHDWANLFDLVATTDQQGRWTIGGVPAGFHGAFRAEGSAAPADAAVAVDDETCGKNTSPEELASQTAVWKLKPVYTVKGRVVDAAGKPVAKARVLINSRSHEDPVLTGADGRFVVPRVGAGPAQLAVQADDFASVQADVRVKADLAEQTITLAPARPLMGRVVDKTGKPVANALIRNTFDRMVRLFDFETRSGTDGRFEWAGAPQRELNLAVYKDGYDVGHARVTPGKHEVTVTLDPVLEVSGAVVDARTRRPIGVFTVLEGRYIDNLPRRATMRAWATSFTGGAYDLKFYKSEMERREERRYLRVEADGYKPAFSRPIEPGDGATTIDFALEPGESIAGRVVAPGGAPVAGAQVAIATPTMLADMYRGEVRRNTPENILFVLTDAAGRFSLPPQVEPFELVVSHESGWARVSREQFEKQPTLMLAPWGRIEGEIRQDGKPAAKAQVTLNDSYFEDSRSHPDQPHVQLFSSQQTDAQGRYVFAKVYPGHYRLSGQHRQQGAMGISGPGVPIDVVAGRTLNVGFGTEGHHAAKGRIVIDESASGAARIDLATIQLELTEAKPGEVGKPSDPSLPRVSVPVAADGTFRIDSVKAGLWRLTTQVDVPAAGPKASDSRGFTSRSEWRFEVPGGEGGPPIPLGDLRLAFRQTALAAGQFAPQFQAKALTGQPLRLRDLRGKYVLLDFWATWCGPCVGETPNLKATYEAFKADPRFAMISLSLDFDPARLRAYVKDNELAWPQALLDGNWENPWVRTYGVSGIPTIILIGPDGKIIAPNLRGPAIKAAVADALAKASR